MILWRFSSSQLRGSFTWFRAMLPKERLMTAIDSEHRIVMTDIISTSISSLSPTMWALAAKEHGKEAKSVSIKNANALSSQSTPSICPSTTQCQCDLLMIVFRRKRKEAAKRRKTWQHSGDSSVSSIRRRSGFQIFLLKVKSELNTTARRKREFCARRWSVKRCRVKRGQKTK